MEVIEKMQKEYLSQVKGQFITRIRHSIRETQENKGGHKLNQFDQTFQQT